MSPEIATLPLRLDSPHAVTGPAACRRSIDNSIVQRVNDLQAAADAAPSALIDISVVAATLSVSIKTGRRMNDSGRLPKPIRIGRVIRWRREEIMRWIEAGCPDRRTWEALNAKRK